MTTDRRPALVLGGLVAGLAALATGVGLLWEPGSDPVAVTTVRGDAAQLFGRGIYRYDALFTGAGYRGTDLAVLVVGVPLLLVSLRSYRRGGYRGRLLLSGAFALFLYTYGTLAVNAAYNQLFLVYVALFSASLFGTAIVAGQVDPDRLLDRLGDRAPRRAAGWLLVASGVATAVIWLLPFVAAQLGGRTPARLDTATTFVTYALDIAVITPSALISGVAILRGSALGYRLAVPLLVIESMLAPTIGSQTAFQLGAGVTLSPGEVIGPVVGFVVLAVIAVTVLVRLLLAVRDPGASPQPT